MTRSEFEIWARLGTVLLNQDLLAKMLVNISKELSPELHRGSLDVRGEILHAIAPHFEKEKRDAGEAKSG